MGRRCKETSHGKTPTHQQKETVVTVNGQQAGTNKNEDTPAAPYMLPHSASPDHAKEGQPENSATSQASILSPCPLPSTSGHHNRAHNINHLPTTHQEQTVRPNVPRGQPQTAPLQHRVVLLRRRRLLVYIHRRRGTGIPLLLLLRRVAPVLRRPPRGGVAWRRRTRGVAALLLLRRVALRRVAALLLLRRVASGGGRVPAGRGRVRARSAGGRPGCRWGRWVVCALFLCGGKRRHGGEGTKGRGRREGVRDAVRTRAQRSGDPEWCGGWREKATTGRTSSGRPSVNR